MANYARVMQNKLNYANDANKGQLCTKDGLQNFEGSNNPIVKCLT